MTCCLSGGNANYLEGGTSLWVVCSGKISWDESRQNETLGWVLERLKGCYRKTCRGFLNGTLMEDQKVTLKGNKRTDIFR